jgi:hypothetical protein
MFKVPSDANKTLYVDGKIKIKLKIFLILKKYKKYLTLIYNY